MTMEDRKKKYKGWKATQKSKSLSAFRDQMAEIWNKDIHWTDLCSLVLKKKKELV